VAKHPRDATGHYELGTGDKRGSPRRGGAGAEPGAHLKSGSRPGPLRTRPAELPAWKAGNRTAGF
jgi:hypothetical protein